MTTEVSRTYRKQDGAVVVVLKDDDDLRSMHTIYLFNRDACPTCGQENPAPNPTGVDLEATIAQLKADIDAYNAQWLEAIGG